MKLKAIIVAVTLLLCNVATIARDFSGGEIQSKEEVQYGRFEIMMYSSDMSGTTSTFFMWKNTGEQASSRWNELDVETFGKSANSWQSNPIWEYDDTDTDTKRWEETHNDIPIANTWVKFTLEWTPNYIAWFNNDVEVRRIVKDENVPSSHFRYNGGDSKDPVGYIADAMRMAFNHWATFPGDWLGPWDASDLPSYQFVDWMTYQPWNGTGFDDVSIRNDFNSMNDITDNFSVSTHTFSENQCQFSTDAVGISNGFMWLGIFDIGSERAPLEVEIPVAPIDTNVTSVRMQEHAPELITIYPNPTTELISIDSQVEGIFILYNSNGVKLKKVEKGRNSIKELTTGVYFICSYNEEGEIKSVKSFYKS